MLTLRVVVVDDVKPTVQKRADVLRARGDGAITMLSLTTTTIIIAKE